jgi:hypothetical protein
MQLVSQHWENNFGIVLCSVGSSFAPSNRFHAIFNNDGKK